MKTKVCSQCKQVKPLTDFYEDKKTGGQRQPCKACMKKRRYNHNHQDIIQSPSPEIELKTLPVLKEVPALPVIEKVVDVNHIFEEETTIKTPDRIVNTSFRVSRNLIKRAKKRSIDLDITLNKLLELALLSYLKRN